MKMNPANLEVPYGFCACGCGKQPKPYPSSRASRGIKKGDYPPYLRCHHFRNLDPEYAEEDRGHDTPCWIWQRSTNQTYGMAYRASDQSRRLAHRVYYEERVGPIPEGLHIDHLCREPLCVNPDHLEPVTHRENVQRGLCTKVTDEQVAEIRALPKRNQGAIAERYGIAKFTVWAIQNDRIRVAA